MSRATSLAAKYGWSHISAYEDGKNSIDDQATKCAQKLLPLLEKALDKRGYRVELGVEIEAHVDPSRSDKATEGLKKLLYGKNRPHTFIRRAGLDNECIENAQYNPYTGQTAFVRTSGENPIAPITSIIEYSTQPLGLVQTAYAVRHIKKGLIDAFERAETLDQKQRSLQKAIVEDSHEGSRFTAALGGYRGEGYYIRANSAFNPVFGDVNTIGEHYNLSVWKHFKTASPYNLMSDDIIRNDFETFIAQKAGDDYLFFAGHDSGFNRLKLMTESSKTKDFIWNANKDVCEHLDVISSKKESYDHDRYERLEIRFPDASCNPFLACLALGALSYAALSNIPGNINATLPNNMTEAEDRFQRHSTVIRALHCAVDDCITDASEKAKLHEEIETLKSLLLKRLQQISPAASAHAL